MKLKEILFFGILCIIMVLFTIQGATASYVAYYSCDNSSISGTNMTDLSGNYNHGILQGSMNTTSNGVIGEGCLLDGASTYIDITSPLTLGNWTFIGFFNITRDGSLYYPFVGSSGEYISYYNESASSRIDIYPPALTSSNAVAIDGQYICIALTYDGIYVNYYVNNTYQGNSSYSINFTFGYLFQDSFGNFFNGTADEIGILNETLTPTQINNTCDNTLVGSRMNDTGVCVPSWSCSLYDSCNISNMMSCLAVNDSNNCSISFNGTLSTYDSNCTYVPPLPPMNESSEGNLSEWRMFGRYLNHSSWDGINFSTISGLDMANYTVGYSIWSSPAVANGYVYVGSNDYNVYQFNASNVSQVINIFTTGDEVRSSPIIVGDYLYIGSNDNFIYQLNATNISQLIAKYDVGGDIWGSPVLADGFLFVSSYNKILYKFDANNVSVKIQNYSVYDILLGSPAVANGYVYVAYESAGSATILQLNESNITQILASYNTLSDYIYSSPVVSNGILYIGGSWMYQLNASNISILINRGFLSDYAFSTPTIDKFNNQIYIGDNNHFVYQFNASNVTNFSNAYLTNNNVYSNPLLVNGYLYVSGYDGNLYQFNASNISILINIGNQSIFGSESSPTYANGYIYVGADNGVFYQLNATNLGNLILPAPPFDITSVFCSSPVSPVESSVVNYTVGANVTSDEIPSVMMTLTLGGSTYNSSSCTYQNISGNNRTFTCEVPFQYYYAPGAYDVSAFFATSNETKNLTSAAVCTYNELLAVVKDRQVITFSAPIIGYDNVSIDVPIAVSNTGNANITSALLTAYDIPGTIVPSYKLFASYFRAGSDLGSSTQLANAVQKNITFTLNPGANATIDFYLWVSVPSDQYPQQYFSTIPWQLILE